MEDFFSQGLRILWKTATGLFKAGRPRKRRRRREFLDFMNGIIDS